MSWDRDGAETYGLNLKQDWAATVARTVAGETTLLVDNKEKPARFGIRSGEYETTITLTAGDYPKIQALFKNKGDEVHRVNRAGLLEAVEMATVALAKHVPVVMESDGGEITTTGTDGEGGYSSGRTDDDGDPFRVGVNPGFTMDILRTMQGEEIEMRPNGNKPIHLRPTGGTAEYLLMPVRLDD